MKCIIVDDELPALRLLTDYVEKTPELQLVGTAEDAFKAMALLNSQKIDIMLLDIQMPELTGIDLLKSLSHKPYTIFTTAYPQYALEGYELNVVDYLLKPITFERFLKAVNKVFDLHNLTLNSSRNKSTDNAKKYMFVKADYKLLKVVFNEILYIEGLSEYVKIFTENRQIITLQSLKNLEITLPQDRFIRIHKSYIISIPKVKAIVGNSVEIGSKKITIGKSYRDKVMRRLKE